MIPHGDGRPGARVPSNGSGRPPDARDPLAEAVPPAPPTGPATGGRPRAVVVGGGIAGLAAACALAERDVDVTVLEREPSLGGRLRGWATTLSDGSPATMTRGFHAFFRQYYNLRALLRRGDPGLGALVPLTDYPLVHRDGPRDRFSGLPATPPWNAAVLAATSPSFPPRDLARVNVPAALQLLDVDVPGVYERLDHLSARDLLDAVRFPPTARHLAFEVFTRSFFADPGVLSAAELALMFHVYFLGSSEGLVFDVPGSPFPQALWDPLERYLAKRGVRLRTGVRVEDVRRGPEHGEGDARGGERRFTLRGRTHEGEVFEEGADAVVLAADPAGTRDLVAASPGLGALEAGAPELGGASWRDRMARVRTAPPFLVSRYWLDRPVRPHRPAFLGTAGYPTLDNISVLERYEDEAREWARRTGGSVVELHAYALEEGCRPEYERQRLREQAESVYPELRRARAVDARHELRADCPLFAPGSHRDRCGVTTPDPFVTVAGDHVRTDLPVALMERAATSGLLAANALLSRWGRPGHTVWTVPRQGRSAPLRALARWSRRSR
ncbi:FAD-dependent oxidoreductase [Nocardiopsis alborubida]|uniref:FAD-dependent oxidoreductase n=1 Tax=Nocardiopsis alborubida TaxID=146802 RepID=A0A7X6RP99_9ACTN|nr:FAD-dependent oxidoreductase [Nocardiopsis alborubida]NKY96941.1 FAD-dependent oxidoreductase [Nocardiopsis alborubida]